MHFIGKICKMLSYCYSDFAKWRSEGSERTILLKAVGQGCSGGLLTCVNKAGLFMRLPAKCLTGCLFCRIFASQFRDNNFKKQTIMLTFGLVALAVVKAVVMAVEFKEIHVSLR